MTEATNYLKEIKRKGRTLWQDFVENLYRDQRKTIISLAVGILLALIFAGIILFSQNQIKASLVDRVSAEHLPSDKIQPLAYLSADDTIQQTKAISVMFSQPHGEAFEQVFQLIEEQESELNRTFYYYPIVYEPARFVDQYQVDPSKVTFVFFEEGIEKNRFTFDSFEQPQSEFIPELNRLPMWTIRSLDDEK